jgi:hypothetical protein
MLILPSLSSLSHFLDSRQQELTKAHRLLDLRIAPAKAALRGVT